MLLAEMNTSEQWTLGINLILAVCTVGSLVVMIVMANKKQQVSLSPQPLTVEVVKALHEQFADKGEFEKLVNHTTNRHAQIFARLDKAEREAREHLAHEVSAIQADRSRAMEKLNSEFIFIRETLSAINTELKLKREEK